MPIAPSDPRKNMSIQTLRRRGWGATRDNDDGFGRAATILSATGVRTGWTAAMLRESRWALGTPH